MSDAMTMLTKTPMPSRDESEISPLERLPQHKLLVGLFLPMQEGAWSPSRAPRSTSWTFDYIARCTIRAEELGFDLAFGLAQWLSKGGYGGEMRFREHEIDPIIANTALAAITKSIVLINTVHILYAWHPLHLAKFGAAIDHISGGRWGVNVVTGYKPSEYRMFGLAPIEHDLRYEMADEFTTIMKRLWADDEDLTFDGRYWKTERAFLAPKPGPRRPFLVNAASSGAGLDYAAKHSDIIFITSPSGADPFKACESLPSHNAKIKSLANGYGRKVKTIINPHVICRPTEKEAKAAYQEILENEDTVAADNFVKTFVSGDTASWRGHSRAQWVIGGNVHLVGTPEQIVDWFIKLQAAGCDGVQVNFFDYLPDLEFFGKEVFPLMKQAGLRS
ncbi:LLM class flavin-dependent oxidoreductase [Bradyrhizobium canariense]|uniref:FMNH2-dependent dimethyl sulfone monooxygenase n=1 Tax=Bradyrhizobium canariense TaxID=255045 RepID=A0A1H1X0Y8_9BRAD|nr:LLM class flavin-dependent oxidoreductase [Bradyrhizobium canariense]SDT02199.1 FMNH2-dependent dimethyl sulfone monooxygenase [Bradyrhizobium canariense]